MEGVLAQLTVWHWLGVGVLLLALEMMFGTFDLLFVAIAAFATALIAAVMPEVVSGWQMQCMIFAIAAVTLVVLGRTVFAGMRRVIGEHPTLNRRMKSLIGQRGTVAAPFSAGQGRVKIGDTEWLAASVDGGDIAAGTSVIVESTQSTKVLVRAA